MALPWNAYRTERELYSFSRFGAVIQTVDSIQAEMEKCSMRVAVGTDHAGFPLKGPIIAEIEGLGHSVVDLGGDGSDPTDDYPDYARLVSRAVHNGNADRGIVLCGSGVGACVAANKVSGIRASLITDLYSAHQGVEHDDMNVICLGARIVDSDLAVQIVRTFMGATFSNEARHVRRLNKILQMEKEFFNESSH
jgi:ribose 5-phosphate isomerase B